MHFQYPRPLASLALAAAVVLLSGTRLPAPPLPPATASSSHNIDRHLLDDTDFVLVINTKQIAASPIFTKHLKADFVRLMSQEAVTPYFKDTGIDLARDVEQFVVILGKSCFRDELPVGGPTEDGPVILLQGKFDKAKIDARLPELVKEGKAKVLEHDKQKLYRLAKDANDNGGPYVAALDRSTLLVCGTKAQVVEQMSRVTGKSKPKLKYPEVAAFLKARKGTNAVDCLGLESMTTGTSVTSTVGNGQRKTTVKHETLGGSGIKSLTVQVALVNEAVKAVVKTELLKAADLKTKADEARQGLAQMKVQVGQAVQRNASLAPVLPVLNGVKISTDKQAIVYEGQATGDQIKALILALGVTR